MAKVVIRVVLEDPEEWELDWITEAIEQAPVDCDFVTHVDEV